MKCLSIRQPWAWLSLAGYKDVENRTWRTHYRGHLLIHAGLKYDFTAFDPEDRAYYGVHPEQLKMRGQFGAIIGRVTLVDCVRDYHSLWAQ